MLVIKVELWPYGRRALARELGRIGVANARGHEVCDYVAVLSDDTGRRATAMVLGHRRSDGFWPLVVRAAAIHGTAARVAEGADEEIRQLAAALFELMYSDAADPDPP